MTVTLRIVMWRKTSNILLFRVNLLRHISPIGKHFEIDATFRIRGSARVFAGGGGGGKLAKMSHY